MKFCRVSNLYLKVIYWTKYWGCTCLVCFHQSGQMNLEQLVASPLITIMPPLSLTSPLPLFYPLLLSAIIQQRFLALLPRLPLQPHPFYPYSSLLFAPGVQLCQLLSLSCIEKADCSVDWAFALLQNQPELSLEKKKKISRISSLHTKMEIMEQNSDPK